VAYGSVYQLDAALSYLEKVRLSRIEEHGVRLAGELREGVAKLGFETLTPPQNPSPIVSFVHGQEPEKLASLFKKEEIMVTLREGGTQVRASVAMFNNRSDVQRLLKVLEKIA
jgi:selenocysteine lyase/cysteine desulfurase